MTEHRRKATRDEIMRSSGHSLARARLERTKSRERTGTGYGCNCTSTNTMGCDRERQETWIDFSQINNFLRRQGEVRGPWLNTGGERKFLVKHSRGRPVHPSTLEARNLFSIHSSLSPERKLWRRCLPVERFSSDLENILHILVLRSFFFLV